MTDAMTHTHTHMTQTHTHNTHTMTYTMMTHTMTHTTTRKHTYVNVLSRWLHLGFNVDTAIHVCQQMLGSQLYS